MMQIYKCYTLFITENCLVYIEFVFDIEWQRQRKGT